MEEYTSETEVMIDNEAYIIEKSIDGKFAIRKKNLGGKWETNKTYKPKEVIKKAEKETTETNKLKSVIR